MPAVTYTPAMRVMNGDYAISGESGVLRGVVLFEKFSFLTWFFETGCLGVLSIVMVRQP